MDPANHLETVLRCARARRSWAGSRTEVQKVQTGVFLTFVGKSSKTFRPNTMLDRVVCTFGANRCVFRCILVTTSGFEAHLETLTSLSRLPKGPSLF